LSEQTSDPHAQHKVKAKNASVAPITKNNNKNAARKFCLMNTMGPDWLNAQQLIAAT